jgi:positive regulator of sigma E activity
MTVKARGRVTSTDGDTVRVKVCHGEYCVGCGMHSPEDEHIEVEVQDPIGVQVGQRVEIGSDPGRMLRSLLLVFWVPLLAVGLLGWLGYAAAGKLGLPAVPGAIVFGVLGLAGAALLIRRAEKRTEAGAGLRILCIIRDDDGGACLHHGSPHAADEHGPAGTAG